MAKRNDSLPPVPSPADLRCVVDSATRDRFYEIAFERKYSAAALLRLVVEQIVREPEKALKNIPKNTMKGS